MLTMKNIKLREMEERDWNLYRDLTVLLTAEKPREQDFLGQLHDPYVISMVADYGRDRAAIFTVANFQYSFEILNLGVLPCFQRQGIASKLVQNLIDHHHVDKRRISMYLCEEHKSGAMFLAKMGFRAVNLCRNACPCGADLIRMTRKL